MFRVRVSAVPFQKEQHLCVLLFLFKRNNTCVFCCSFSKGTAPLSFAVPFQKEQHFLNFCCSFSKGTTRLNFCCSFSKGTTLLNFLISFKEQHLCVFFQFLLKQVAFECFCYLRTLHKKEPSHPPL